MKIRMFATLFSLSFGLMACMPVIQVPSETLEALSVNPSTTVDVATPVSTLLWEPYASERYLVSLKYPSKWYDSGNDNFRGEDGYVSLTGSSMIAPTAKVACEAIYEHTPNKLGEYPYGTDPSLEFLLVDGQPACLIFPSDDQRVHESKRALLFVDYPPGNGQSWILAVTADRDHIRAIAGTLKFVDGELATSESSVQPTVSSVSTPGTPRGGTIYVEYGPMLQQRFSLSPMFYGAQTVFRPLTNHDPCFIKVISETPFQLQFDLAFEDDGQFTTSLIEESALCEITSMQPTSLVADVICHGSGSEDLSFSATNQVSGNSYRINIPIYSISQQSAKLPVSLPESLSIEEYAVETHFVAEARIEFTPLDGEYSRQEVLEKHAAERQKEPNSDSFILNPSWDSELVSSKLANGDEISFFVETKRIPVDSRLVDTDWEEFQYEHDVRILHVLNNGEEVLAVELVVGVFPELPRVWIWEDHWSLEIERTSYACRKGDIFVDGQSLSELNGYYDAFFQVLHGKPFYFYERDEKIGINYDGQDIPLGYDGVPHTNCCSGFAYNIQAYENMVAFFPMKDDVQYYVEIGVFE